MQHQDIQRPVDWYIFAGLCLWLGFQAVYRLTALGENLFRGGQLAWDLALDMGMVACVIWLSVSLKPRSDASQTMQELRPLLTILGLLAGGVILVIRMSGQDGWHSGHLYCC